MKTEKNIYDAQTWTKLRDTAHETAKSKGFHEATHSREHILMLVVTELSEAVEADRKGRRANLETYTEELKAAEGNEAAEIAAFENHIKDSVEDEVADAAIRLLDFAGLVGEDLGGMEQISQRSDRKLHVSDITPDNTTEAKGFCEDMFRIVYHVTQVGWSPKFSLAHIIAFADAHDIDLLKHVELKMGYNATRPRLHGKTY